MRFDCHAASDIGRRRSQNQDNLAIFPEIGLFIVADGMGGHKGGEIASALAVKCIPDVVRKAIELPDWNPRSVLTEAIRFANQTIFEQSLQQPQLRGMGTTVTTLLFKAGRITIGHVGDSRCYYLRRGTIWQATRDHSLVQEKMRAGLITREEAKTDRLKNVITRSVGFEPEVNVELYEMAVKEGDTFLMCSDGLSGIVEDIDILNTVEGVDAEIKAAVENLINAANEAGGDDNITAIMVRVLDQDTARKGSLDQNDELEADSERTVEYEFPAGEEDEKTLS